MIFLSADKKEVTHTTCPKNALSNNNKKYYLSILAIEFAIEFAILIFFLFIIISVPADSTLSEDQINVLRDVITSSREKLQRLTIEHRDLHGTVSKVGKAIDRNFVSDLSSTTRTDVLVQERNLQLLNKVIAQHFYRQGMDEVADNILKVCN